MTAEPKQSVIELDVGHDLMNAKIVAEACRAEGYHVELRERDELGAMPGFISPPTPHRLLARAEDAEALRGIAQRSIQTDSAPVVKRHPLWARRLALAVAASILIPLAIGVIGLVLKAL